MAAYLYEDDFFHPSPHAPYNERKNPNKTKSDFLAEVRKELGLPEFLDITPVRPEPNRGQPI